MIIFLFLEQMGIRFYDNVAKGIRKYRNINLFLSHKIIIFIAGNL